MPRIAISYRRDDSLDITGRIFDRLAGHFGREAVFRDIDSIPPGADFRRHIEQVLDESDIILAIIGPRWIGPDNEQLRLASPADPVRVEIETALRKDKPLIPVLVSRAVMPQPDVLPVTLHDFVYRNAVQVDSGQDFDVHVGRLIRAIERLLRIDKERTADEAVQGVVATIGAAPRIEPTPKAEAPVNPVTPVSRVVRVNGTDTVGWVIGIGLVVMLGLIGAGGWWINDPTSALGLPAGAAAIAGGMYAACIAAEKAARPGALRDLGGILADTQLLGSIRPYAIIERMFYWTFGERHFSLKCVTRSFCATTITVCAMMTIIFGLHAFVHPLTHNNGTTESFLSATLVFTFAYISDYLSLAKTRIIISLFSSVGSALLLVFSDILLSILISIICYAVSVSIVVVVFGYPDWSGRSLSQIILSQLRYCLDWMLFSNINWDQPLYLPMFISTIFTSIWVTLILLSTVVIKIVVPTQRFVTWFFEIETRPLRAIGIVSGTLIMIGSFTWSVGRAALSHMHIS